MKNKLILRDYFQLSKVPVVIPVSLTCFTAYFLVRPVINHEIILVSLGVFFLAIAASALNQVQEVSIDSRMLRTIHRPLPEKRLNKKEAILFILFTFITGSLLLFFFGGIPAMLIGWLTIFWYNGVYTPLKRKTAFAVIPGSLTGAFPPLIGWVAAGGSIFDKGAVFLAFMFFMAQVPHFWLIILKYGKQYSEAELPNLLHIFSKKQVSRLTYVWVVSSVICALILTQFGFAIQPLFKIIVILLTAFIIFFFSLLDADKSLNYTKTHFILLNSYFMCIMIILVLDQIIAI